MCSIPSASVISFGSWSKEDHWWMVSAVSARSPWMACLLIAMRSRYAVSARSEERNDMRYLTGAEVRRAAASGDLTGPTPGLALGYVQANLVIVPRDLAFDFLLFCQRNPKPCPLLDVTEPGSS